MAISRRVNTQFSASCKHLVDGLVRPLAAVRPSGGRGTKSWEISSSPISSSRLSSVDRLLFAVQARSKRSKYRGGRKRFVVRFLREAAGCGPEAPGRRPAVRAAAVRRRLSWPASPGGPLFTRRLRSPAEPPCLTVFQSSTLQFAVLDAKITHRLVEALAFLDRIVDTAKEPAGLLRSRRPFAWDLPILRPVIAETRTN